jgi:hypothetical protein
MGIVSHKSMTATILFIALVAQGHAQTNSKPNAVSSEQPKQGANQNASAQTSIEPTPQSMPSPIDRPQVPGQVNATSTPANSPSAEPKDSFSQLTLFLFGSGLALFIALLGWSDQIRGIDKDTKELEHRFLEKTGIQKREFLDIVKPESPDAQLLALTQVMTTGRIKSKDSAELLRTFTAWNSQWSRIERLSAWKYNLTITLTSTLFVVGVASLFITSTQQVRLYGISVRTEMAVLILPILLIGSLLAIIICIAHREKELRVLLNSMSDMV